MYCFSLSGKFPDWHLEYIQVEELTSGRVYNFPCDNWIGKDYKLKRILSRMDSRTDGEIKGYFISLLIRVISTAVSYVITSHPSRRDCCCRRSQCRCQCWHCRQKLTSKFSVWISRDQTSKIFFRYFYGFFGILLRSSLYPLEIFAL